MRRWTYLDVSSPLRARVTYQTMPAKNDIALANAATGGAIDYEIALPKILDPRGVEGGASRLRILGWLGIRSRPCAAMAPKSAPRWR